MTLSSPQACSINSANSLALRTGIGERLSVSLDQKRITITSRTDLSLEAISHGTALGYLLTYFARG